jgi:transcriptional regulator
MYAKSDHAETDIPTLHAFIRRNPLGIVTTAIPSDTYPLLQCTSIPWVLDVERINADETTGGHLGVLRGHMARANQQVKAMIDSVSTVPSASTDTNSNSNSSRTLGSEVMILFNGPVDHYITPKFYTATKPATGKVVPTWNYTAAQVYGRATIYFDANSAETDAFLSRLLEDLTRQSEEGIMRFDRPWTVDDAPENYVRLLKKAIVGIEVRIDRLEGKFKVSQEKPVGDREGVIQGLESMGTEVAMEMASTVRERGALRDEEKERAKKERPG